MNPFDESDSSDDAGTAHFLFDINSDRLLSVNPFAVEITGFPTQELLRKKLRDVFGPTSDKKWRRFMDDVRQHESLPYQAGFVVTVKGAADPTAVHLSATRLPSRSKNQDRALVLLSAKDSRYVEAQSLFRQVFNNLSQSLYVKDKQLNYVAVNRAFCAEVGRSPDEILGHDDFAVFPQHVAERQDADEHRVLQEGRCFVQEEQSDIGGRPYTLQIVKSPVYAPNGDIDGVLAMRWDVTSQNRRHENELEKKKSDAIGRLAGGIAHHFNNLLTIIRGNIGLAQSRLVDPKADAVSEALELLAQVESATHRGAEMVRNLLSFARRSSDDFAGQNLNEIVKEAVVPLTGMSAIQMQQAFATDLWNIHGDREQLRRIIMSLCVNAVEAMPGGGTLSITTANVHFTQDNLLAGETRNSRDEQVAPLSPDCRPGDFVHLQVRDTGVGMSPDIQASIFDPFFTTKPIGKGIGLSLAMAKGSIEKHSGWIEFRSESGRGATFDVYLPRHTEAPSEDLSDSLDSLKGSGAILLVDHHRASVKSGKSLLKRLGYTVFEVDPEDWEAEHARLRESHFDLIVLDFTLPLRTGQETLQRLRDAFPGIPLVLAAADPIGPALLAKHRYQAAGFVHKPYILYELGQVIRYALEQSQSAEPQPVEN